MIVPFSNTAKISAIIRKATAENISYDTASFANLTELHTTEVDTVNMLNRYTQKIQEAAKGYAPSIIANYAYDLAKTYSKFYAEVPIFAEEDAAKLAFRIALSAQVARVIKSSMALIGVDVPDRM